MTDWSALCCEIGEAVLAKIEACAGDAPDCCETDFKYALTVGGPHPVPGHVSVWLGRQTPTKQQPGPTVRQVEFGVAWSMWGYPHLGEEGSAGSIPPERLNEVAPYFYEVHNAVMATLGSLSPSKFAGASVANAAPLSPNGGSAGFGYVLTCRVR